MFHPARPLAAALLAMLLSACSTHPLPEDFSHRNTRDLVHTLRCEIADGVTKLKDPKPEDLATTAVGVDFKLNMNETNNATGGKLSLAEPITGGKLTLDFTGSAERDRTNERAFRIIDTFEQLVELKKSNKCSKEVQRADYLYPIAGSIGLDEVVSTYWDVKGMSTFDPKADAAFVDKIIFKTKLSAGLSPNITISSTAADLRLTNVAIDGSVIREDVHQLTISIVTAKPKENAAPNKPGDEKSGAPLRTYRSPEADDDEPEPLAGNRSGSSAESAVEGVVRELNRQRRRDDLRDYAPFRF